MIADLADRTYIVRHNPNCPKPFQVIVGCGFATPITVLPAGHYIRIDGREKIVGYGMTLDEAAAQALERIRYSATHAFMRDLTDGL